MVRSILPRRLSLLASLLTLLCPGMPGRAQQASAARPLITRPVDNEARVTLRGNVHPLARTRFDEGQAPVSLPAQRQLLVLRRSPERELALRQYLAAVEDRNSPTFHHYLMPAQFAAQFGPASSDVAQVTAWLAGEGFTVNRVAAGGMAVEFSGSVAQMQSAFRTEVHRFRVNGRDHLANVTNPSIPAALAPVVAGVSPLNDFYPRPQQLPGTHAQWSASEKRFVPSLTIGLSGTPYLFVSPGDAATIYNAPTSLNTRRASGQSLYDGTGVTIGIVTDGGVSTADVQNYRALFQLPPALLSVVADGNAPTDADDTESTLDAEVAGAIAPGAKLVFYQAADTTFESGVMLALLRAIDDNTANILNISYSACELAQGAAGNQAILNAMEQAAAQGIAVTVASGDSGSAACDDATTQTTASHGFGVNALASTPYAVAVGGTDFGTLAAHFSQYVSTANSGSYTSALGYIPETAWNNSTSSNAAAADNAPNLNYSGDTNIAAGGGGTSGAALYDSAGNVAGGYAKPAWQQQFEASAGIAADAVRDLPDVALFAGSGLHGALWATCRDSDCQGASPTITGVGGTSASAPAFAGLLALINQKLGAASRLGQPNWILYALAASHPADFHAIATGNNAVVCAAGSADCAANGFLEGYDATGAYNLATGLGSVDMAALVNDWTSVGRAQSSVTLSLGATTFQHGSPIAVSVAVTPSAATGTVALTNNIAAQGLTGNSSQLGLPLSGGQASATWQGFPGGTYNVYASYSGDGSYAGALSSPVQVTVTPENSLVRLSVTGAGLAGASIPYGSYISVDARPIGLSQAASANPLTNATGTVTFSDTAHGVDGSGMLDASGNAEFPAHAFTVGAHTVTAAYSGDNSYNATTSAPVVFTVTRAPTVASIATSASSIDGGVVTVAASIRVNVAGFIAAPPSGNVTFTDATSGAVLGVAAASTAVQDSATGAYYSVASIDVPAAHLAGGSNRIVASYDGDMNFLPSSASAAATVACAAGCGAESGQSLSLSLTQAATDALTVGTPTSGAVVTAIPGGGFTGAVQLTCTVSGAKAGDVNIPTCSLSPVTVTIANTAGAQSSITVKATPTSSTASLSSLIRGGAALCCLLCFGVPGRRRSAALLRVLLIAAGLGAVMAGMSGCGSGSSVNGSASSSPVSASTTTPDTYTVTLHAADVATGTVTAQTSFTVTVQ